MADVPVPRIVRLTERIQELPTLPSVIAHITRLVEDPETSAGDIQKVLSEDPALAGKVLKLVNSAYYGFSRRISSITHAVVILGFNIVRYLAISSFAIEMFRFRNPYFDYRGFWVHSLGCAAASDAVARRLKRPNPSDLFMAGLLHDIGKVVLAVHLEEEFTRALREAHEKGILLREAETALLGATHADVGGALLEHWRIPAHLVAAVRFHHAPAAAGDPAGDAYDSTAIVHVGDALARALLIGDGGDARATAPDPEVLATLKLAESDLGPLMDDTLTAMEKVDDFLELIRE